MKKLIGIFKSSNSAFILALLGVISQFYHIYFIVHEISSLSPIWREIQAIILSLFLAGALFYFTLRYSDATEEKREDYYKIIMWFVVIDTMINLYYYISRIFLQKNPNYWEIIPSILIAILIPQVLKIYAGEVKESKMFLQQEEVLIKINDKEHDALIKPKQ